MICRAVAMRDYGLRNTLENKAEHGHAMCLRKSIGGCALQCADKPGFVVGQSFL